MPYGSPLPVPLRSNEQAMNELISLDEFTTNVIAARERADVILQQALAAGKATLPEAFQELDIALEELRVANEELCEQNLELASTRSQVELERQRYQELFEFAPEAYLVTRPDGVILEANRAAVRLLNSPLGQLIGKPLAVFIPPAARRDFRMRMDQLRRPNQIDTWNMPLQPRNTPAFDAAVSVGAVMDRSGKLLALRWLLRDQTARRQAEEAQRRAEFIAQANRLLASSLDYDRTLTRIMQIIVPAFADLCLIHLRHSDGTIGRVEVAHRIRGRGKQLKALAGQPPIDLPSAHPVAFVLRTGKRRFLSQIDDALLQALAPSGRHLRQLRELKLQSLLALPLRAHGRLIGALTFGTESERRFTLGDLVAAQDLARHIALAIDNAELYQAARRNLNTYEETRAQVLQELAGPLSQLLGFTQGLKRQFDLPLDNPSTIPATCEQIETAIAHLQQYLDHIHHLTDNAG